jgi:hypothetical protein
MAPAQAAPAMLKKNDFNNGLHCRPVARRWPLARTSRERWCFRARFAGRKRLSQRSTVARAFGPLFQGTSRKRPRTMISNCQLPVPLRGNQCIECLTSALRNCPNRSWVGEWVPAIRNNGYSDTVLTRAHARPRCYSCKHSRAEMTRDDCSMVARHAKDFRVLAFRVTQAERSCNTCREPVPHTASIRSPHRLPRCRIDK